MSKRDKGFINQYDPSKGLRKKLKNEILELLNKYNESDDLPITVRTIYYRMIAVYGHKKDEGKTKTLGSAVNDVVVGLRRSEQIPFNWISDDRAEESNVLFFDNEKSFISTISNLANTFVLDRQAGQKQKIIVACEAKGSIPLLRKITDQYTIPVMSSSGFDGLKPKMELANKAVNEQITFIHLGDCDPSGMSIFDSMSEDVNTFCSQMDTNPIDFQRLALTPEMVLNRPDLQALSAPKNPNDNRKYPYNFSLQLEALEPSELRKILDDKICSLMDMNIYAEVLKEEVCSKKRIIKSLSTVQ